MFCTKLKELKLSGECPFSMLSQPPEDDEVPATAAAGAPICSEESGVVRHRRAAEEPPQRKSSRTRVYLHTLAESIHKLIFPEVIHTNFIYVI